MFFSEEKLESRINQLQSLRYTNRKEIKGWKIKEDDTKEEKYPITIDNTWNTIEKGTIWEGRDRYFWFITDIKIPNHQEHEKSILLFDFGKSAPGNTAGFEALCFINGEPYQGVDGNHKEVFIDQKFEGQDITVALKLWGGLEGGGAATEIFHQFKYADYAILSEDIDDLYYTAKVMLDTIKILGDNDPNKFELLKILNGAFKLIDWSYPESKTFYESIHHARILLNTELESIEKSTPITVTAIGHTHIDVAWLWRLKHTREKSARSFSTVLRLMEKYPEYVFLQTQPQLYEYIKQDYPEIYKQIKEKVVEGKWEIDGAMWLESDANIPSGESLVRQILFGSRFIKEEFNEDIHYLWLPDVFGYSWALPQILKKSGIDMFMTTKISWNQFNRMPNDTFKWRGIDGSEVLTHFITTPDPNNEQGPFFYTYNGLLEPYTVKGVYDGYQDKDINNNLLLAYGYGDGGGGVNREMLENGRRIKKMPGLPNLKMGRAREYFKELKETVNKTDNYVHTWDGELYLEYHRGTYTSQANNKKENRKLELAYRESEFLHSWMMKEAKTVYPSRKINEGWKIILRNQFHDIIPGSSIKEVYEDSHMEYEEAGNIIKELTNELQSYITPHNNVWTIFNSAGWKRNELVHINDLTNKKGYFQNENGNKLKSEKWGSGYIVQVLSIPALGSTQLMFIEEENTKLETPFDIKGNSIETPYYEISWTSEGKLDRIYDKMAKRNVLKAGGYGNVLQLFEDKPMNWDAWDIDIFYNEKKKELSAKNIKITESNSLFAVVQFVYEFGKSKVVQEMKVYSDSKRIDFKTNINWQERQQLLKAAFEVDIRSTEASYDIQYGNVKRPTHWNTSWDMARFETVGHQWADLSETGYGVSLLNDSKYGYDIKDHTMRISLLKGAIYPDPEADRGNHEFTYSLLPHEGDFLEGKTVEEAWSLNNPIGPFEGKLDGNKELFQIESSTSVVIDAIKKAEDGEGIIIRLHDHTGGNRKVSLKPQFNCTEWIETNLMEKEMSTEYQLIEKGIQFQLKPFEIKTFLVK